MPRGAIGSTSDFDSEGSRFEPWRGIHSINISMMNIRQSQSNILRAFIETEMLDSENLGGHPKGVSLINRQKNICAVLIPKNASTSLNTSALSSNADKWVPFNFLNKDDSLRYIVILRDPVKRFISALNMFLTTGKVLYGDLPLVVRGSFRNPDCHFLPQTKFIKDLPRDQIDFFFYNKTVLEDIEKHYGLKLNQSGKNENIGNKLVTEVDNELIKKLYSEDYELINSVNFINV